MIICKTENGIGLRWREGDEIQSKIVSHSDFQPYMYADKAHSALPFTFKCKDNLGTFQIKVMFESTDEVNLNGDKLHKVTWQPKHPKYAKDVRIVLEARGMKT